ncbi:hypothetical protein BGZ76_005529, partial [Entomortierella beljakovae]
MVSKVHLTLDAFRKASLSDLGPVAFVQWALKFVNKSDLHTKYLAIASNAASSEDLDLKAAGILGEGRYIEDLLEGPRASKKAMAAKDSSKLQKADGRHQLRQSLMELKREQERQQQEQEQEQQKQEQEHQQQEQQQQKQEQEQNTEQEHQQQEQQQQEESDTFCTAVLIPSDTSDDDYSQSQKSSARTSFGSTVTLVGRSNIDGPGEPSCQVLVTLGMVPAYYNDVHIPTFLFLQGCLILSSRRHSSSSVSKSMRAKLWLNLAGSMYQRCRARKSTSLPNMRLLLPLRNILIQVDVEIVFLNPRVGSSFE